MDAFPGSSGGGAPYQPGQNLSHLKPASPPGQLEISVIAYCHHVDVKKMATPNSSKFAAVTTQFRKYFQPIELRRSARLAEIVYWKMPKPGIRFASYIRCQS